MTKTVDEILKDLTYDRFPKSEEGKRIKSLLAQAILSSKAFEEKKVTTAHYYTRTGYNQAIRACKKVIEEKFGTH